jgi:hypothetical protein
VAQSGNGVDIGTIYQLLTQMSARMDTMSARFEEFAEAVSRKLADHSRDLDDLKAGMTELRKEVSHYHAAVTSQGIHYSELEGRTLRIERHLKLEPGE